MSDLICRVPHISDHITTRLLGHEAFIMNLKTLKTYALNETAARIWCFIDSMSTVGDIIRKIESEFNVHNEKYTEDISEIFKRFEKENLIVFEDSHV